MNQSKERNKIGPLRSYIFNDVKDPAYLPKAFYWLYKKHVEDSISMFDAFCLKYCTYHALPVPPMGAEFGTYNWIMTEHHYMIDRSDFYGEDGNVKPYAERFDDEFLEITNQPTGKELRNTEWCGSKDGYHPIVNCFVPLYWEKDLKGKNRTIDDGANTRWLCIFKYPKGVSREDGDRWFFEKLVPKLTECDEVLRFLTAACIPHPEKGPWDRVMELWFDDTYAWQDTMKKCTETTEKPEWAEYDKFPYLEPYKDFTGIFLMDRPDSNHLQQYRGYIVSR